jgi:hypothetical protein
MLLRGQTSDEEVHGWDYKESEKGREKFAREAEGAQSSGHF